MKSLQWPNMELRCIFRLVTMNWSYVLAFLSVRLFLLSVVLWGKHIKILLPRQMKLCWQKNINFNFVICGNSGGNRIAPIMIDVTWRSLSSDDETSWPSSLPLPLPPPTRSRNKSSPPWWLRPEDMIISIFTVQKFLYFTEKHAWQDKMSVNEY